MSTVTLQCPRCSEHHCIDLGPAGDFPIGRQGTTVLCPFCKNEFRARTTLTQTVHEQIDASAADLLFHSVFHDNPAAEAVAKAEYRRLAHTGEAIVLDPRD